MSRRSDRYRDSIRKQGSQHARVNAPMLAIPRTPHPAQLSKRELRELAERAAAEHRRRHDPSGD